MDITVANNKTMQLEAISSTVSVLKSEKPKIVTISVPTEQVANLMEGATASIHSVDFISDQSQFNNSTTISEATNSLLFLQTSKKPTPSFPVATSSLSSPHPRKAFFHRQQDIFGKRSQWVNYFQSFQRFQKSYLLLSIYQIVKIAL